MALGISSARRFSFTSRPTPVPGDLRINWRLAVILLMLESSRAKKASLAKLHLLNDAVRSTQSLDRLRNILSESGGLFGWHMRVEPAFGRAIDFAVGEKLTEWVRTAQRSGLQLTKQGTAAAAAIAKVDDVLTEEKEFFNGVAKQVSEDFVTKVLRGEKTR